MSSTSGGCSVGIVHLQTKGHGVCFWRNQYVSVWLLDFIFSVMNMLVLSLKVMLHFGVCKEMYAECCLFLKCVYLLQQPLKRQTLRNISIFNKLLYDVCELQNSVNELLLSTAPLVSSFFGYLEISSDSIWVIWGTNLQNVFSPWYNLISYIFTLIHLLWFFLTFSWCLVWNRSLCLLLSSHVSECVKYAIYV
jgi:hypothetical protein